MVFLDAIPPPPLKGYREEEGKQLDSCTEATRVVDQSAILSIEMTEWSTNVS